MAGDGAARLMGLDIGDRRIGVALSDELGLTAQPLLTLERSRRYRDGREEIRALARLARRYGCTALVAGDPLHMDGEAGTQAEKARAFARQLAATTGLPLHLVDERLTTREAHALLYQAGRPRQEHRAVVDQVAAVLLLQGFLDAQAAAAAAGDPEDRV